MNTFKLGSDFENLVSPLSDVELLNLFIQSCSQIKINGITVHMFSPPRNSTTVCKYFL